MDTQSIAAAQVFLNNGLALMAMNVPCGTHSRQFETGKAVTFVAKQSVIGCSEEMDGAS
jgi:hypothetical protein